MLLVHQTIALFLQLMKKKNLSANNFKLKYLMLTFPSTQRTKDAEWGAGSKMYKKSYMDCAVMSSERVKSKYVTLITHAKLVPGQKIKVWQQSALIISRIRRRKIKFLKLFYWRLLVIKMLLRGSEWKLREKCFVEIN